MRDTEELSKATILYDDLKETETTEATLLDILVVLERIDKKLDLVLSNKPSRGKSANE